MRVLMVGISPSYGGTEAVIYSLLPFFKAQGIFVDFINTYECPLAKEEWLKEIGSHVHKLNLRRRKRFWRYHQETNSFFSVHKGEWHALWINMQYPDFSSILRLAKNCQIKKRIVVAHNSSCPDGSLFRKVLMASQRRAIRKLATDCVAVSSKAGAFCFGKRPFYNTITNGIDI